MKFIDLFKLSTRMFKARTSRTILTVLGMSVGIAAILFLVSLGEGLRLTLLDRITTSDSLLTLDVSEGKEGEANLDIQRIQKIAEMSGVEEVSPSFSVSAQGKLEGLSADLSATSAKSSFLRLGGIKSIEGSLLDDAYPDRVVVASAVSKIFGKQDSEMIGKKISLTFFPDAGQLATGVDILENKISREYVIGGVVEGEDEVVYVNSTSTVDLKVQRFSQVKVKCHSTSQMGSIRDDLTESGLMVSSLSDTVDQANKIFNILRIILMLFGAIALVVSAIGMFNTMTIALLERTEEIGIMKSIGASDRSISGMFFMESTIMGFLGGVMGVVLGWVIGKGSGILINLIAGHFGGQKVNLFSVPLWLVVGVLLSSGVVGFMTGYVPARRASKTDPLDALRYK